MRFVARVIASVWTAAAFAAGAQSAYRWTDITPALGGSSDSDHSTVNDIGIHPLDANRLIIAGGFHPQGQGQPPSYSVMYSDDGGQSWNPSVTPSLSLMFVPVGRPGVVYLTDPGLFPTGDFGPPLGGHLYRSDDFGRTWSVIRATAAGESSIPFASDPLDAHGIYAIYKELFLDARYVGFPVNIRNPGTIRTHDDGVTWSSPLASPLGSYYFMAGPTPSAPTRLFIGLVEDGAVNAAQGGTIVSVDSGATWSRADPATWPLRWIYPDPLRANVLYGYHHATADERLYRSDDGGATWRQIFSSFSTPPNLYIDPAHPNILWMPYRSDTIYRSEDRGETWHQVPFPLQDLPPHFDAAAKLVPSPAGAGVVYLLRFGRLYRGEPVFAPDPVVVEYQYEGDRYWLTSLDGEAVSQDYRQQPGDVHRTGLRWGAWGAGDAPSGAVGSCRFWSRPESGLRTRVLVLQGFECEILRRNPGWILEAENEFYAVAPVNGRCANGLVAVQRFNNLSQDLNHRWVADEGAAEHMRALGWYDEGVRFCARPLGPNE